MHHTTGSDGHTLHSPVHPWASYTRLRGREPSSDRAASRAHRAASRGRLSRTAAAAAAHARRTDGSPIEAPTELSTRRPVTRHGRGEVVRGCALARWLGGRRYASGLAGPMRRGRCSRAIDRAMRSAASAEHIESAARDSRSVQKVSEGAKEGSSAVARTVAIAAYAAIYSATLPLTLRAMRRHHEAQRIRSGDGGRAAAVGRRRAASMEPEGCGQRGLQFAAEIMHGTTPGQWASRG